MVSEPIDATFSDQLFKRNYFGLETKMNIED